MLTKKSDQVDLKKCCPAELKDILDRQLKLLNNSKFISKLPDKGKKIKFYKEKLEQELEARSSLRDTCELMSKMALNKLPNEIEWCGKKAFDKKNENDVNNDDDDEEEERNPLKIVATHSGTIKSYTKKKETSEPSLVTSKDLEDSLTIKPCTPLYASKICHKFDKSIAAERFKPNEPKDKILAKERLKRSTEHVRERLGKRWEVTAATPPVPVHGATEMVSLSDSLLLQHEQARRVKEIQLEEAASRLRESITARNDFQTCLPTRNLMKYRDPTVLFEGTPVSTNHDSKDTDEDAVEIDEAVIYNLVDDENG